MIKNYFCRKRNSSVYISKITFKLSTLSFLNSIGLILFFTASTVFAQDQVLEMAEGDGNPTVSVTPVTTAVIRMRNNTNNPSGNNFATHTPSLNVTYKLTNQQYTSTFFSPLSDASAFGYPVFDPALPLMNAFGGALNSDFTSSDAAVGTGIDVTENRAVEISIDVDQLDINALPVNTRQQIVDLEITFDRAVNNPSIHISALGGGSLAADIPNGTYSAELDVLSSNVPVILSKVSGTTALSITTTQINNSATVPNSIEGRASGTVLVSGEGITSLIFRVYLRGVSTGAEWSFGTSESIESFMLGMSIPEANVSIDKVVNDLSPLTGSNVIFTLTATNNGISHATGVSVNDLLPSGYSFVSATPSGSTTYSDVTGLWNVGGLNNGASETLQITAVVEETGVYTNTATITADQQDPDLTNNSSSVTPVPFNPCGTVDTDGDGIFDLCDLDDDNDGVLDTTELSCGTGAAATTTYTMPIGTQLIEGTYTNGAAVANYSIDLSDASVALVAANNYSNGQGVHYIFSDAQTSFTATQSITPQTGTLLNNVSWGPGLNGNIDTENDINSQTITLSWTPAITATVIDPDNQLDVGDGTVISSGQVLVQAADHLNSTATWSIVFNTNLLDSAFTLTTNHADATALGTEGYDLNAAICYSENTDGDSVLNHLDLDSDGDGCSDSVEASNTLVSGNDITNYNTGTDANNNGLLDEFEDGATGNINYDDTYEIYANSNNLSLCADTDGDGVGDLTDLDDDNDGVLDEDESPDCFYTETEIGEIVKVTSALTSLDDDQADGDIQVLHDGISTYTFNFNAGQNIIDSEFFRIEYPSLVQLTDITLVSNTTWGTGVTTKLQGSLNGVNWVTISAVTDMATTANKVFSVTDTNKYKYYRVLGETGTTTVSAATIGEITSNVVSGYVQGLHPKENCSTDTDGDGSYNHVDLDSDGDGCSDGVESGNTLISDNDIVNFNTGTDANSNGLLDEFEDGITGNIKYASTYRYAINSERTNCVDTDGDNIGDLTDIDDDNDGILDVDESIAGPSGCTPIVSSYSDFTLTGNKFAGRLNVDGTYVADVEFDIPSGQNPLNSVQASTTQMQNSSKVTYSTSQSTANDSLQVSITLRPLVGQNIKAIFRVFIPGTSGWANHQGAHRMWLPALPNGDPNVASFTELNEFVNEFDGVSDYHSGDLMTNPSTVPANAGYLDIYVEADENNPYTFHYTQYDIYATTYANESIDIDLPVCSPVQIPPTDIDTDGDSIPDRLDLDSDGDNCSDSVEAGNSALGGNDITNYPTGTDVNNNGLLDIYENGTSGDINYESTYGLYSITESIDACKDTDGDGIVNLVDLDDDNDGVLDEMESSDCFYNIAEINQIEKITTNLISPDDDQSDGDIQLLHDEASTYIFNFNAGQNISGEELFKIEYPSLVQLADITLVNNTTWGAGVTAKLQGSIDGNTWVDASSVLDLDTTADKVFTSTNTNEYKYYRILGETGTSTIATTTIGEITSTVALGYVIGLHPKAICTSDTDGDTILNHLDLDSDGDGCSDGVEVGNTPVANNDTTNYNTGTDANSNGLLDQFEDGSTGTLNYVAPYFYAASVVLNACLDTDGDGVNDLVDIDDDNDGALDITELGCGIGTATVANTVLTAGSQQIQGAFTNGASIADYDIQFTNLSAALVAANIVPIEGGIHYIVDDTNLGDYEATLVITPQTGSLLQTVEWGPNLLGNTDAENDNDEQTITLTWEPAVTATVVDPDNQLDIVDGTIISPGQAIFQGAEYENGVPPTWKIVFDTNLLPIAFQVNVSHAALAGVADLRDEGFSLVTNVCYLENTDADAAINSLDLDSDGDGCSDSVEASNTLVSGNDITNYNTGTDANNNGLLDVFEDGTTGDTNYLSTYYLATSSTLNACADSDGDGVGDLVDLDDDNDGVLDTTELSCGTGTAATTTYTMPIGTQLIEGTYTNGAAVANYSIDLSDASVALVAANNYSDGQGVHYIFNDAQTSFTATQSITPQTGTLLNNVSWGPGLNGNIDAENDINSQTITLNWTPAITATVIDPDNQLDVGDGTIISSGQVLVQAADHLNSTATWSIVFNTNLLDSAFTLTTNHTDATALGTEGYDLNAAICYSENTDGDSVLNHLDLDSDGDGCSDSVEASNTLVSGNDITNYNTGTDANNNGLLDEFEDGTTGNINYLSTHYLATSSTLNACADSDGDGVGDLVDLDDDNDGVLDTTELSCGTGAAATTTYTMPIGTQLIEGTYTNGAAVANYSIDLSDASVALVAANNYSNGQGVHYIFSDAQTSFTATQSITPQTGTLLNNVSWGPGLNGNIDTENDINSQTITLSWTPAITATVIDPDNQLDVGDGTVISSGQVLVQAADHLNSTATWSIVFNTNLLDSAFTLTTNHADATALGTEGYDLNAAICYSENTDGDSVLNHLDLDSDGDGCSDSVEASNTLVSGNDIVNYNTGTDANNNGLLDEFEDGTTGNTNYLSTYYLATSSTLNACADSDGDGVGDLVDLDDDNDGVLDTTELSCGTGTAATTTYTMPIGTQLIEGTYTNGAAVANYSIDLSDASVALVAANNYSNGQGVHYIFSDAQTSFTATQSITPQTGTLLNNVSWGPGLNGNIDTENDINSQTITLNWTPAITATVIDPDNQLDVGDGTIISSGQVLVQAADHLNSTATWSIVFNTNLLDSAFTLTTNHADATALGTEGYDLNAAICYSENTDGDSVLNHLDLDSDGDGCSDSVEASNTLVSGNDIVNYNTGTDANNNGLLDEFEDGTTGNINYTSTYAQYALSNFLSVCTDTDGDGVNDLSDLDDDNDGVLDAIESPACFYDSSEVVITNVTTSLTNYSANVAYQFSELYDEVMNDIASFGALNTNITGETVYELEMAFPVELSEIDVVFNYSIFRTSATFKWQGYNGSSWVDVTGVLNETETTNNTYTYTLNQTGQKYSRYRLLGVSGTTYYNRIYEIVPKVGASYKPSLYPKNSCSVDTDSDTVFNHLDLDSDGDGCSDSVESDNTPTTSNDIVNYNTGADANSNGLLDQFEDGTTGNINYTSTYNFAIDNVQNACIDTDGDGVGDVGDIDDDNDGIYDTDEMNCNVTEVTNPEDMTWHGTAAANVSVPVSTTLQVTGAAWSTAYSDQTFTLPLVMEGTITSASNGMIGFFPVSGTEITGAIWNDGGYKFQFDASNGMYVRHGATNSGWQAPSIVGTTFRLEIDAAGNMSYIHNGSTVYTGTVPLEDYKITLSRGAFTIENFTVSDKSDICASIDSDGDTIPDHLELDSDGDGCSDANEAYGVYNTDGGDGGQFGIGDPLTVVGGQVNADGSVITAPYNTGIVAAVTDDTISTVCPVDIDGDGIDDATDLDDDNDGVLDTAEGLCTGQASGVWAGTNPSNGSTAPFSFTSTVGSGTGVTVTTSFSGNANNFGSSTSANFGATDFWTSASGSLVGANSFLLDLNWDSTPDASATDIDLPADDKGSGVVTITFTDPVTNPVIHLDRLGGASGTTSNSLEFELTSGGTLSRLSGTDDFEVQGNFIRRSNQTGLTSTGTEALMGLLEGTAAGSVAVIGTFTTLTFNWTGTGVEGSGGDAIEVIVEGCTSVDTDDDGTPDYQDLDSDKDGCNDVLESGGVDTNSDGILDGDGFNASGQVTTGGAILGTSYDGVVGGEILAVNIDIDTAPSNVSTSVSTSSVSFTVVSSADQATSFTTGTPNYSVPNNATGGLTYQWYDGDPDSGGTILTNTSPYSNVTTSVLGINPNASLNGKTYYVVVKHANNSCGEKTSATLCVVDDTLAVSDDTICLGATATITLSSSVSGVNYQLRLDSDDSNVGSVIAGTGGNINFNVTPIVNTTYNILASNGTCSSELTDKSTVTVTPTVTIAAFSPATSTRCQGAGTVTTTTTGTNSTGITYSLDAASLTGGNSINGSTGEVTYVAGWSGTTTITASAAGCNGPATTTHVVTVTPTVTIAAFSPATSTRCQGAGTVTTTTTGTNSTGITYSLDAASLTGGNSINGSTGEVIYVAGWSGTTTITASAAGCNGPATTTHVVTVTPTVTIAAFSPATSTRCQGAGTVTTTTTGTNSTGITYSLDAASLTGGNSINSGTGEVTYVAGWSGTTTITASAAGCNGPATTTHVVTVTPTVTIAAFSPATSTRCQGAGTVTTTTTGTNSTGITYSLDAASLTGGNSINSGTGEVTYVAGWSGTTTITASAAGCNGPATTTHVVTVTPTVTIAAFSPATSTRCQGAGTVTTTTTGTNSTGITYSLDAASLTGGNSINGSTGEVTYVAGWSGTTTITASAAGCNGPATTTHVVTVTPTVTIAAFSPATSTRCQGAGTVTTTTTGTNSTGITYSLDAASLTGGNSINGSTGEVTYVAGWSGTTTITASAAGCNGPATTTHVVTVTPTVTIAAFSPATSTRCQGAGTVTTTTTGTNSTGITYSLDVASLTGGNSINGSTGEVIYVAGWSGTTTITASAAGCNGPATTTHVVTVTPTVTIAAFSPATSTRCQGAGTVTTTTTGTNSTGITYSLDAASLTGGNSINSGTGEVTYVAGWSGTTTITASAAGCNGPATTTHVVTVTPTVTIAAFSPATSTRCQGAGTVTTTTTGTNSTGITYSLDAASLTGGNSINGSTGEVTYVAGWSGTTTITASAAGCNGPVTTTHVVTVTPTVTIAAFSPATSARCQGAGAVTTTTTGTNTTGITYSLDAASLTGGNSINGSTGEVTYVAGWSGTTTITASAAGCNGPATTTHVVTVTPPVTIAAFSPATSTRCQGAGAVTTTTTGTNTTGITYSLDAASLTGGNSINGSTGEVTYVAGWSGTTTITASAAGCNGPATTTHVVTVTPTVTIAAFSPATSTRCQGAGAVTTTTTGTNTTGITYSLDAASLTGGNSINSGTGEVTYVAGWSGTTTITASAAGCNGPATTTHVVTVTPTVTIAAFSPATSTRCQGAGAVTTTTTGTNTTGITYSLDAASLTGGNSINGSTGEVTYVAGWSGTTTITASAAGCNGPATTAHVVTVTPTVMIAAFSPATSTRCQGAGAVTTTTTGTNTTGITYSLDAASLTGGNSINGSTGEVTYVAGWSGTTTITASAAGCNGPATTTHVVTVAPTVTIAAFSPATSTRCQGAGAVTTTTTGTNTTGITYSLDTASLTGGNSINGSTGEVTYVAGWSGTTTITASAAGCNGPATTTHVVTVTPTVMIAAFSPATSTRCQGAGAVTMTTTGTNTTGITYSLDAASLTGGNSINGSTGEVTYVAGWSGTTTITASAAGCNGPATTTHVVTVTPTVTIAAFSPATSTRCQGAGAVTTTTTGTNTTGITYSLDAASLTGGNSINGSTGEVTYVAGWSGTTTITASAAGCNGPATTTHVVTVTPTVTIAAFSPATSTRCQGAGAVTTTTTGTNTTGITYSLDAASLTGGNSINGSTGEVTYVAGWSGTTTITASAAGCNGPATTTHVVTVTPTVTIAAFSPATSTRCQGAGAVTTTTTGTNTTGITYSLDAASLTGGNSINGSTGEVTYVAGWSGTTTITASAAGCNGPATTTHVVTVTPTVTIAAFSPATSTRCQGAGAVTTTTTGTNSTGITYSLDAASLTGGNSINGSTGEVTYVAGWSGTTTITASAAGCNGPATTTHVVTVTPTVTIAAFSPATSTRCQGAGAVTTTTTGTNTTGITYSLDAASLTGGNSINGSTGEVTYVAGWSGTTTITASAAGCNGPATTTHVVTVTPTVTIAAFSPATSTRCQGAGAVTTTTTGTNSTGITYSLDAASLTGGNSINGSTGEVTYVAGWSGTTTITASAAGCNGPATTTHVVTVTPTVTIAAFSPATSTRCQGAGAVTTTTTGTNSTGITYSLDAASLTGGNSINGSTGEVTYVAGWSGTTTITASAAGCNGPVTTTHVVTVTPTVTIAAFSPATSTRCQGAGAVTTTTTGTNTTGITYSLDAASLTGGNSINGSTGEVTYVAGWSGTTTITASAAGCNGPATTTHVVTVTPTVTIAAFSPATSTRCQGAGAVTTTTTGTNTTGITYSLDAASLTGGNSINSGTGEVTYVAGWSGTTTITASAAGCNGPATTTHVVTVTPTVTIAAFSPAISTRTQGAGTVTTITTGTNTTGITYSLDAASLTGGNSINGSTGEVTYVAGWSGTTTITASAAGCNGPATTTHVVTILLDTDGDGIPDIDDLDDDNDGILDSVEENGDPNRDTDGDGIPDRLDLDSDGDGILDLEESGQDVAVVDADGNGVLDSTVDADNDGIIDTADADDTDISAGGTTTPTDTDEDGNPDFQDVDSDNDGISDLVEGGTDASLDADNDGILDDQTDTDGDGIADVVDPDNGGTSASTPDTDNDGTPDYQDLDSDNDGINDVEEAGGTDADGDGQVDASGALVDGSSLPDTDGNGTPDVLEPNNPDLPGGLDTDGDGEIDDNTDSDGDGIPDVTDGDPTNFGDAPMTDTDGDGIPDVDDLDDDNDGILDSVEENGDPNRDTDGDGIPDRLDLDSDGDGILDLEESGQDVAAVDADGNGVLDSTVDADNDGIIDTADADDTDISAGGTTIPTDTDEDGNPDFQDVDSDNDGISDLVEGGTDASLDADNDGILDDQTDTDGDGIADVVDPDNGGTSASTPDADNDGTPDYQDLDSDNDGINDVEEAGGTDADGDGQVDTSGALVDGNSLPDTDGNGTPDVLEPNNPDLPGGLDTDGDGVIDDNTDSDGDGIPDVTDGDPTNFGDAPMTDTDGDGIPDVDDLDDDNDGILDSVEENGDPNRDTDGDGIPDRLDLDSDGDGILDLEESGQDVAAVDADGNGVLDSTVDADNDGIIDTADADDTDISAGGTTIPTDTDEDGNPDFQDVDSDNDGISDLVEGGTDASLDADNDGILDDQTDTDGDGIADVVDPDNGGTSASTPDADNDGTPDYQDLDSDNDGINDVEEAGGTDADGDGQVDTSGALVDGNSLPDTDGNGTPDVLEPNNPDLPGGLDTDGDGVIDDNTDSDGDGIPDVTDGDPTNFGDAPMTDTDGDGIPDVDDLDDDNDGILDSVEENGDPNRDTDGDGIPDRLDLDSDGDGILDLEESGQDVAAVDADGNGVLDSTVDADNDGIIDTADADDTDISAGGTTTPTDTDEDGNPDFQDVDSDNDGISDLVEGGTDASLDADNDGILDDQTDTDGDGIADVVDPDNGGTSASTPDTDNDGTPDYQDLDSDNDGINDVEEAGGTDADGDGQVDTSGALVDGSSLPDTDGNGSPDVLEPNNPDLPEGLDTDGDGVIDDATDTDGDGIADSVDGLDGFGDSEQIDTDGDGIPDIYDLDDDNDGILDTDEGDGGVDTDEDGIPDSLDSDSDNDGVPDVIEGNDENGDGIPDISPSGLDTDNDGLDDAFDSDNGGTSVSIPDTDEDGIPDFQDTDDDNDGIDTINEGPGDGDPTTDDALDTNDNGIPDYLDSDQNPCGTPYNIMTPDDDGENDTFFISCIDKPEYSKNTVEIFNRWGNTVYKASGYNNESVVFRGVSSGRATISVDEKLPPGTYYYVIDLGDGSKPKAGWLYINR